MPRFAVPAIVHLRHADCAAEGGGFTVVVQNLLAVVVKVGPPVVGLAQQSVDLRPRHRF